MLKSGLGGQWDSLSTAAMTLTGFVQLLCTLAAFTEVEKQSKLRADEVARLPVDHEVLELEEQEAEKARRRAAATQWNVLPLCMKLTLVLAALSAQAATYLLYTTPCFVDIEVTTNLEQVLRVDTGGTWHWYNVVKYPTGVAALMLTFASWIFWLLARPCTLPSIYV